MINNRIVEQDNPLNQTNTSNEYTENKYQQTIISETIPMLRTSKLRIPNSLNRVPYLLRELIGSIMQIQSSAARELMGRPIKGLRRHVNCLRRLLKGTSFIDVRNGYFITCIVFSACHGVRLPGRCRLAERELQGFNSSNTYTGGVAGDRSKSKVDWELPGLSSSREQVGPTLYLFLSIPGQGGYRVSGSPSYQLRREVPYVNVFYDHEQGENAGSNSQSAVPSPVTVAVNARRPRDSPRRRNERAFEICHRNAAR